MNIEASETALHPGGHPSRMTLGKLLSGECDASARTALETHIAACRHCSGVYENARLDMADFARRRPTLESGAAAKRRAVAAQGPGWSQRLREWFNGGFGFRPALAGMAMVLLASGIWVFNGGRPAGNGGEGGDLTAKGSAHFQAYVNGQAAHGDTLACEPKDTLQIILVADAPVHYALLFRDDGGPIMPYMLGDDAGGKPLGTPRGEPLPHSLVMSDGWSMETLYCISSPRAFTLNEAEQAVALGGGASGGLRVQIFLLANRSP